MRRFKDVGNFSVIHQWTKSRDGETGCYKISDNVICKFNGYLSVSRIIFFFFSSSASNVMNCTARMLEWILEWQVLHCCYLQITDLLLILKIQCVRGPDGWLRLMCIEATLSCFERFCQRNVLQWQNIVLSLWNCSSYSTAFRSQLPNNSLKKIWAWN